MSTPDDEAIHKKLFRVHGLLVAGAEELHALVVLLTRRGRHEEDRKKLAVALQYMTAAREMADKAWQEAAKARSETIRVTGCSGECNASAS